VVATGETVYVLPWTLRPNAGLRAAGHLRGPRSCFARVSLCFRNQPLLVRIFLNVEDATTKCGIACRRPSAWSPQLLCEGVRMLPQPTAACAGLYVTLRFCALSASELRQPPPCVAPYPHPSCVSHRLALHHIRFRVASATALRCIIRQVYKLGFRTQSTL